MKYIRLLLKYFLGTIFTMFIMFIILLFVHEVTKEPTIIEYQLSELNNGIYATYQNIVSNVPANNYSMVTFVDKNGNVITVKGTVNIVYSNDTPKAILKDVNLVNEDEVTIFIPEGTMNYLGTSNSY